MAESRPEAVFLLSPEARLEWTFWELREQSIRLAHKLSELGFGQGDKIGFMMDNGLFTAGLFLGAMYGGFVPVPLNVRAGRSQVAYMLDHSDAKVVFVSDEYHQMIEEIKAEVGRDLAVIRADVDHGPCWEETELPDVVNLPEVQPDQDAVLIYTSGSTGQPKGALHTHRNFVAGSWNSAIPHELSPTDRTLCVLPLYHMNAEKRHPSTDTADRRLGSNAPPIHRAQLLGLDRRVSVHVVRDRPDHHFSTLGMGRPAC